MRPIRPGRKMLVGLALAAFPASVAAQACVPLPARTNELWLGVEAESGAERRRAGVGFSFNLLDRVTFGADVASGGYDTGDEAASSYGYFLGARLTPGAVVICPTIAKAATTFSYVDRFDADLGEVADQALVLSVPMSGRLATLSGAEVGWWLAPELRIGRREVATRVRVIVDALLQIETDEFVDRATDVGGRAALTVRLGPFGFAAGVGSRVDIGRHSIAFVRIGVIANQR